MSGLDLNKNSAAQNYLSQVVGLTGLAPAQADLLARSCSSLEELRSWGDLLVKMRHHSPPPKQWFEEFLKQVNQDSMFPLSEWSAALEQFSAWMLQHHLQADPREQVSYLWCCSQSGSARLGGVTLIYLLDEMLESHGFEAARPVDAS